MVPTEGNAAEWLAALAAVATAAVAALAARTWHMTLAAQRGDNAIVAAYDLISNIEDVGISVERAEKKATVDYQLYAIKSGFLQLKKTYMVARRSYPKRLSKSRIDEVHEIIVKRPTSMAQGLWDPATEELRADRTEFLNAQRSALNEANKIAEMLDQVFNKT